MKQNVLVLAATMALGLTASAQDINMPGINLNRLAQHASESVNVTLDGPLLQLASGFLSKDDPDEAKVKKVVSKLKGVYVHSFEFEKEGEYSISDVQSIREQLRMPVWSKIVSVTGKTDNTEIYVKKDGDQIGGLVVIDAEPKELTLVHIDGPINPEELSDLGGHMGIPKLGAVKPGKPSAQSKKNEDDLP
jgi:Domain of unknown function (DUF4252)